MAASLAFPAAAQTWTTVPTSTDPGGDADDGISLAYDLVRGQVVKYGGRVAGAVVDSTWTYDGLDWTQRTPANNPGTRWGHRLVHDLAGNRVLMFGGRKVLAGTVTDEIWAWDGTDWTQLFPSTATTPGGRVWHQLAFDWRRGRMVLFGGFAATDPSTWEFDVVSQEWIQLTPATRPPNVYGGGFVYDSSRGVCVLFGGWDGAAATYAGTWEWDGRNWRETFALGAAGSPGGRSKHQMSYDLRRGVVIMHGGYAGGSKLETWSYDGAAWTLESTLGTPPPQPVQGGMAYDVGRDRHVHYGGTGPSPGTSTTTSEFEAATRPSYAKAGEGCPGSNGVVALGAQPGSEPRSGTTFVVQATGVPAVSPAAVLVVGTTNVSVGPVPLPLDLALIQLPDCWLDCSPDFSFPVAPIGGTASWSLPIPSAVQGLTLWNQALVLDPGAPNAGLATLTNACRAFVTP